MDILRALYAVAQQRRVTAGPGRRPARAGEHPGHPQSTTSTPLSLACAPRGAELVGELERYEDSYRLCYVRGPEGIIFELTVSELDE